MKITDIIRKVIDVIDQAEAAEQPVQQVIKPEEADGGIEAEVQINFNDPAEEEIRRFKQIAGLTTDAARPLIANAPDEKYADIDAVTTLAGGGLNGPKHPADIKGSTISMYPGKVYGAK